VIVRAFLVAAALAAALLPLDADAVERWYSTGLYPRLQAVITPLSNSIPIALLDLAAGCLIVAGTVVLVRRAKAVGVRRALARTAGSIVTASAVLYLLFLLLWGLNYRRTPLERKLDYDSSRVTRQAATALANTAVKSMNGGFAAAHARGWDAGSLEPPFGDVQRGLGATRTAVPGVPKLSLLSLYFRRAAIDGMTDPFFLEIILNADILDVERPFITAHEWAHLAGYADESEANFVAWLTCLRGDSLARYSGWVSAYEYAMRALPRADRAGVSPLEPGPSADLRAMAARYERSSPVIRETASDVYDKYLRANRVEEGIASYDAVLRLMLGTRLGPAWATAVP
jgi:uncharacterized protein DUF3810